MEYSTYQITWKHKFMLICSFTCYLIMILKKIHLLWLMFIYLIIIIYYIFNWNGLEYPHRIYCIIVSYTYFQISSLFPSKFKRITSDPPPTFSDPCFTEKHIKYEEYRKRTLMNIIETKGSGATSLDSASMAKALHSGQSIFNFYQL